MAIGGLCCLAGSAGAEVHFTAETGQDGMSYGAALCEVPDINGDGFDELLVGAPLANAPGLDSGRAYLRLGGQALTVAADQVWDGPANGQFGWAVAWIGDVNNDNVPDWAVGEPLADNAGSDAGRVYIYYGEHYPSSSADVIINGASGGDQFGFAISAAGDFDGDGYDDFIVGAPYSDLTGEAAGAAYVIYGSEAGPSSSTALSSATVLTGEIAGDHFGWSVTGADNFLGHTAQCVAVGAPLNNTHGGIDGGAVYVFEGSTGGATPNAVADFETGIEHSAAAYSQFGFVVEGVGNWDGDSIADLAVGAPYCNAGLTDNGSVEIIFGATTPNTANNRYVHGESSSDLFGYSLAWAHDVSGTSRDDVLIGAPGHNDGAAGSGRAYIYEGDRPSYSDAGSLVVLAVSPLMAGTAAGDGFGHAVASAGYFDDDGDYDVAVGAPSGNNIDNVTAGYVWLQDSSDTVVPTFLSSWRATWTEPSVVALEFDLNLVGTDVQQVTLQRRHNDGPGAVVWSGAAVTGTDATSRPDQLLQAGATFRFLDTGPFAAAVRAGDLGYDLTVLTEAGESVTLPSLDGPGPLPDADLAVRPLELGAARPNPFNPSTTLRFRAEAGRLVTGCVTDLAGRRIATLPSAQATGLWQDVTWRGADDGGRRCPSGVYFVVLTAGEVTATQRVVLAK